LSSPSRRLQKVTRLWARFSIRRIRTFPLTMVSTLPADDLQPGLALKL
jgi:hypothetical protein